MSSKGAPLITRLRATTQHDIHSQLHFGYNFHTLITSRFYLITAFLLLWYFAEYNDIDIEYCDMRVFQQHFISVSRTAIANAFIFDIFCSELRYFIVFSRDLFSSKSDFIVTRYFSFAVAVIRLSHFLLAMPQRTGKLCINNYNSTFLVFHIFEFHYNIDAYEFLQMPLAFSAKNIYSLYFITDFGLLIFIYMPFLCRLQPVLCAALPAAVWSHFSADRVSPLCYYSSIAMHSLGAHRTPIKDSAWYFLGHLPFIARACRTLLSWYRYRLLMPWIPARLLILDYRYFELCWYLR